MNVPAATAVPITPATLGPIACISRKLVGSASAPTFWDTRAANGITERVLRLSAGIEDEKDLIEDLEQAFESFNK